MMRPLVIDADCFESAYTRLLASLLAGSRCSPRGLPTREHTDTVLWIANPRTRVLSSPERHWNPFYAIAEFVWQFKADADPSFLGTFASWWTKKDGAAWAKASCYGLKLFRAPAGGRSQFDSVVSSLRRDPDSRRAVFTILSGDDVNVPESVGIPCTVSLQVLVRDGKLSMHTMMRSCDAYRGLPYDFFFFTLLQELIATTLGLEIGSYTHSAASAHIYESDVARAERYIQSDHAGEVSEMRAMDPGIKPRDIALVEPDRPQTVPFLADLASVLAIGRAPDKITALDECVFHDQIIASSVAQYLHSGRASLRPCGSMK